jgi:hypothetical protein
MLHILLIGALIGIGGTVAMDVWAVILWKGFGEGAPNYAAVGRWTYHLKNGTVFHDSIGKAAPYAHEQALGWAFHYFVGIVYGIVLALFMGQAWLAAPTLLPALIWGIVTIAAGWFFLHPGLGLGWMASKAPNPTKVRAMGLIAHAVFALGMWIAALLLVPASAQSAAADEGTMCAQVVACGIKDGKYREYPTSCDAESDGATQIAAKTGESCPAIN